MPLVKITVLGYRCERCRHEWVPRGVDTAAKKPPPEPRVCPKCKSPYWNKPRKREK